MSQHNHAYRRRRQTIPYDSAQQRHLQRGLIFFCACMCSFFAAYWDSLPLGAMWKQNACLACWPSNIPWRCFLMSLAVATLLAAALQARYFVIERVLR
eukprot:1766422-Pleurochrysis_carterae.AAC.1